MVKSPTKKVASSFPELRRLHLQNCRHCQHQQAPNRQRATGTHTTTNWGENRNRKGITGSCRTILVRPSPQNSLRECFAAARRGATC